MQIIKPITVDLQKPNAPLIVNAKQNDKATRYIYATLIDGSSPYTIDASAVAEFRAKKPDGTGAFYDATISGNIVQCELKEQVLTVAGDVKAEINLYTATGSKLTSFAFTVKVEESVLEDATIVSSDYFNALTETTAEILRTATMIKPLGYYATVAALQAAVTSPNAGDMYGVGSAEPYDFYTWDAINSEWVNNGQIKGQKGDAGVSVTVGTTTTGAAGTQASVSNSGTASDPILNFTIPQGAKGEDGNVSSVDGAEPDANGNVQINAVAYNTQTGKTDAQKAQARANIGAADVAAYSAHYDASGNVDGLGLGTPATGSGSVDVADSLQSAFRKSIGTPLRELSAIGLTTATASSYQAIHDAMPVFSTMLVSWCGQSVPNTAPFSTMLPGMYGVLRVVRFGEDSSWTWESFNTDDGFFVGHYSAVNSVGFRGWKTLAKQLVWSGSAAQGATVTAAYYPLSKYTNLIVRCAYGPDLWIPLGKYSDNSSFFAFTGALFNTWIGADGPETATIGMRLTDASTSSWYGFTVTTLYHAGNVLEVWGCIE